MLCYKALWKVPMKVGDRGRSAPLGGPFDWLHLSQGGYLNWSCFYHQIILWVHLKLGFWPRYFASHTTAPTTPRHCSHHTTPSQPFTFLQQIYHPNVDKLGRICLDVLKDKWSPALQIRTVLLSIQALLSAPNPDDPLDNQVADHWKKNEADAINTGTIKLTCFVFGP